MLDQITQIGREWKRIYQIEACGIGFGGPVSFVDQRIALSTHVGGWQEFALPKYVESVLGVPAIMDNDANVGGLGEYYFGAGQECRSLFYMTLSTGIGGGILIDGKIYRGPGGTAGEIGHITLDESGPVCRCGNRGCLETFAAARYVLPLLQSSHGTDLTMEGVVRLARDGDPGCRRVIADVGRHIGSGVANLCNLLNPSRVVLGGDLAEAGELVLGPIRESVGRYAIPSAARQLSVLPGALGGRAEVLGALALALSEMGDSTLLDSTLHAAAPAFT